jgi:hypothetical protein
MILLVDSHVLSHVTLLVIARLYRDRDLLLDLDKNPSINTAYVSQYSDIRAR